MQRGREQEGPAELHAVRRRQATGQRLDDTQIRDETIIFLIAGHETTSGLLSFAIYALLNNPEVLAKAYAEVDRVLGPDPSAKPTYAQVNQLTYMRRS